MKKIFRKVGMWVSTRSEGIERTRSYCHVDQMKKKKFFNIGKFSYKQINTIRDQFYSSVVNNYKLQIYNFPSLGEWVNDEDQITVLWANIGLMCRVCWASPHSIFNKSCKHTISINRCLNAVLMSRQNFKSTWARWPFHCKYTYVTVINIFEGRRQHYPWYIVPMLD